jgi:hypothetical protein
MWLDYNNDNNSINLHDAWWLQHVLLVALALHYRLPVSLVTVVMYLLVATVRSY